MIQADPDYDPHAPLTRQVFWSIQAGKCQDLRWPSLLLVSRARETAGCKYFLTKSSDSTLSKLLAFFSISSAREVLMTKYRYMNFSTTERKDWPARGLKCR